MRIHTLKFNIEYLKRDVDRNYLILRDIYYRCLVVNLCAHQLLYGVVPNSVVIEDAQYGGYMQRLSGIIHYDGLNEHLAVLKFLVAEIDLTQHLDLFMDMHIYLSDFIALRHDNSMLNIYSLSIDDNQHVSITNKQMNHVK